MFETSQPYRFRNNAFFTADCKTLKTNPKNDKIHDSHAFLPKVSSFFGYSLSFLCPGKFKTRKRYVKGNKKY